jgi:hypothetical protein
MRTSSVVLEMRARGFENDAAWLLVCIRRLAGEAFMVIGQDGCSVDAAPLCVCVIGAAAMLRCVR